MCGVVESLNNYLHTVLSVKVAEFQLSVPIFIVKNAEMHLQRILHVVLADLFNFQTCMLQSRCKRGIGGKVTVHVDEDIIPLAQGLRIN
jgi:hypothetical protein